MPANLLWIKALEASKKSGELKSRETSDVIRLEPISEDLESKEFWHTPRPPLVECAYSCSHPTCYFNLPSNSVPPAPPALSLPMEMKNRFSHGIEYLVNCSYIVFCLPGELNLDQPQSFRYEDVDDSGHNTTLRTVKSKNSLVHIMLLTELAQNVSCV